MSKRDKDRKRGLYGKYDVERRDGSSEQGKKHDGCYYFVLDLDHDYFSVAALEAYANVCEDKYPSLAHDLRQRVAGMRLRDDWDRR